MGVWCDVCCGVAVGVWEFVGVGCSTVCIQLVQIGCPVQPAQLVRGSEVFAYTRAISSLLFCITTICPMSSPTERSHVFC